MKLYFVRHGKTEWNLEGRFQGATQDSPLLTESRENLALLGKFLSNVTFDTAYSSDLERAKISADIIMAENRHPIAIQTKKELREWYLGNLEGQKISIMSAIYPTQMAALFHNLAKFNNSSFNAESVYHATHRTSSFIKSIFEKDTTSLIVGHGLILNATINHLLGFSDAQLLCQGHLKNGSVTILETQDGKHFKLINWSDTSFLDTKIS